MRRRTAFAAPFVLTLACGKSAPEDPLGAQYSIQKGGDGKCLAYAVVHCPKDVNCNPPGPRTIACPDPLPATIVILPDNSCAIVPPDCEARSCATQKTPCPEPYR
jgi:hypothetical protein